MQINPQELSALNSILPSVEHETSSGSSAFSKVEPEFEEYLKNKLEAEEQALAPNKLGTDEIPKPLSRENYLSAFDNEPDPLFPDAFKARSADKSAEEKHSQFDELFKSARGEAFNDKDLFY